MNKTYTYTFSQTDKPSTGHKLWLGLLVLPAIFLVWIHIDQLSFFSPHTTFSACEATANLKDQLKKLNAQQQKDIDLIARTIYGEARGEKSFNSLKAIGHVILNRTRDHKKWPSTIEDVILQKGQFSCWNQTDPNFYKIQSVSFNNKLFLKCFKAALHSYFAQDDVTKGANHYHAREVSPWWAKKKNMVLVAQMDRHIFYKSA